jgi:hypothetical protein
MSDIIDINVAQTVEEVTINVVDNVIQVNINQVNGGGSQDLNETLVNGNATDGEDIFLSDGDSILLDNGSKLKKGTTNAGNGGNNGIALKCSLDYEFKWEAGRMYIMQQDGVGIRETRYNFNVAPTVNDDDTKGYAVDSRWILDNGDLYICTDATEANAVWELQSTIPTLQEVLEEGNITTEGAIFGDPLNDYISIGSSAIGIVDTTAEKQASISAGQIVIGDNDLNYVEMSLPNGFAVGDFISQNAILNGSGLEISNDILKSSLASNFLQFDNFDSITPFTTSFSIDKLATDNGDYLYPTGPSSQLATLLDIPTNTSDLINDGENGTSPYVTADQLPSNLNLFATDVSSDIPTYFKLVTSISDPDYNDTPVNIPTGAITTTGQFIAALATTANVLVGNPGIINLLTIGNVRRTSGSGTAEFYYEVYHRTSGGTETLIATSSKTPPINTNVYTEFLAAALLNNGTFLTTDRIVIKYYADRVGSGSNPNYDFQFGGTSPVRTNFPVPASNIPLDAIPTDGSTNGVQSNGVFDALALKQDKSTSETFVLSKANGTFGSHTGTTAETVLFSANISAGEFTAGDFMRVMLDITKLGTAGTANVRLRAGTAGTTSDALIGTFFLLSGTLDAGFIRERFQFLSGNLLSGIQNNYTSAQTDIALNSVIKQSTSLTPSNAWKLTVTVALTNSADTVSCLGYRVSKIKTI